MIKVVSIKIPRRGFLCYNETMSKNIQYFLFFILSIIVILPPYPFKNHYRQVLANQELDLAQADRSRLEAELTDLEAQIAQKQKELDGQKGQSASLSRDIAILTTQINKAKLDIKAKNLVIQKLGGEINQANNKIQTLTEKIEAEKASLAQLLRKSREIDDKSLVEFVLSKNTISEAYGDLAAFASINEGIKSSVEEITGIRVETEASKKALEKKKDQETDVKVQLENTKKQVEQNEKNKQQLLSISKNKEAEYQKIIAEQQKKVAEIKARLFNLAGVSQPIRFDLALQYAEEVSAKTGVDPAFLLAIITQESKLGANVGKCYLTDSTTGAGVNVNTGKVWSNLMKATRDVQPFLEITNKLGLNAFKTAVSCPIASSGGYGGAMGPAQFIPSTWKIFESKISELVDGTPNPWDPRDAFMASALYLTNLGASGNSYTSQIKAACKYYGSGGSTCSYSKSVMKLKTGIQSDIDYLKEYGVSKR